MFLVKIHRTIQFSTYLSPDLDKDDTFPWNVYCLLKQLEKNLQLWFYQN